MNNFSSLVDILIKDETQGISHHEKVLILGHTPENLIKYASFDKLPLIVTGKVISKAVFDHAISTSILKRLPKIISEPKSIYKSANEHQSDSVVVLTLETQRGYPIVIPIIKNKLVGRSTVNMVTSVYAKEGVDPELRWRSKGLLLWSR